MKKIISAIGIALVVIALGLTSYYYFVFDTIDPATGQKETFRQFLPFGSSSAPRETPAEEQIPEYVPNGEEDGMIPAVLPALQQITKEPVAGSMLLEQPYSSSTLARYMDRATGNIYDFSVATGTTERITNTTFPKIIETLWNPRGSKVVMRSLQNDNDYISSYYAEVQSSTSSEGFSELQGKYLPTSIDTITLLGGGDTIFSLIESKEGALGYTSTMDGEKRTLVFQSPIREWIPQGLSATSIALTTKASSYTNGFLFMFNPTTDSLTKVVGNILGLTTLLSPDGRYALISENNNGFTLKLLDIKNKEIVPLTLSTIPEKCAWAADSSAAFCGVSRQKLSPDFLDLWYQGIVSTSDDLWVIEPANADIGIVADIADKNIDMTGINVSKNKKSITFINKKDLSLWVYRIPQPVAAPSTASSTATTSADIQ